MARDRHQNDVDQTLEAAESDAAAEAAIEVEADAAAAAGDTGALDTEAADGSDLDTEGAATVDAGEPLADTGALDTEGTTAAPGEVAAEVIAEEVWADDGGMLPEVAADIAADVLPDARAHPPSTRLRTGGVASIHADDITIDQGGAAIIRSDRIRLNQGGALVMIGRRIDIREGGAAVLIARRVSGNVNVALDWRSILALIGGLIALKLLFRGRR